LWNFNASTQGSPSRNQDNPGLNDLIPSGLVNKFLQSIEEQAIPITPKIAIFILSGDPSVERWIPPKTAKNREFRCNHFIMKSLQKIHPYCGQTWSNQVKPVLVYRNR
jgi:hypothetical protein